MTDFKKWMDDLCVSKLSCPEQDKIIEALNSDYFTDSSLDEIDLDIPIVVLSNYYMYLKFEEGKMAGRVSYLLDSLRSGAEINQENLKDEKAKLAILRPILDGLKNKIDVLRKIYDKQIRKSYELRNIRS